MMRSLAAILFVLVPAALAGGQGTIDLRQAAAVRGGEPVLLSQVATLGGAEALALGGTVVAARGPERGAAVVTLEQVRASLKASGVNWSRLALRGGTCTIRPVEEPPVPGAAPAAAAVTAEPADDSDTIRAAVVQRVSQITQVDAADLRLAFDSRDREFLGMRIAGRTLEIKSLGASDRLPLALTLYEGERVATARTIRVGVLVRREVLICSAGKKRGEVIGSEDVTADSQWLALTAAPAGADRAIGAVARARIAPGEVISVDDLAPPIVVDKGEVVAVRCVSGGVVVSTKGRALAPARDGELVRLQAIDSDRVFSARMDGRGRAILVNTQSPPPRRSAARPASSP